MMNNHSHHHSNISVRSNGDSTTATTTRSINSNRYSSDAVDIAGRFVVHQNTDRTEEKGRSFDKVSHHDYRTTLDNVEQPLPHIIHAGKVPTTIDGSEGGHDDCDDDEFSFKTRDGPHRSSVPCSPTNPQRRGRFLVWPATRITSLERRGRFLLVHPTHHEQQA